MSKFDDCIQSGDKVIFNEDLGCRVNLSQLNRVAKKEKKHMKFKIGDIVEVVRQSWYLKFKTVGALGKVVDIRSFHSHRPTHYVVKFTHYTIPHYYPVYDFEECCELYKVKR